MINNKQSSVDWLLYEILLTLEGFENTSIPHYKLIELGKKAKIIHKEEIENAQMDMFICLNELPYSLQYLEKRQSAEDFATHYYNETFGGNNEQQ